MALISNTDVGSTLSKVCEHDVNNDAIYLARAANIVRRDMFKMKHQLNDSFEQECP